MMQSHRLTTMPHRLNCQIEATLRDKKKV